MHCRTCRRLSSAPFIGGAHSAASTIPIQSQSMRASHLSIIIYTHAYARSTEANIEWLCHGKSVTYVLCYTMYYVRVACACIICLPAEASVCMSHICPHIPLENAELQEYVHVCKLVAWEWSTKTVNKSIVRRTRVHKYSYHFVHMRFGCFQMIARMAFPYHMPYTFPQTGSIPVRRTSPHPNRWRATWRFDCDCIWNKFHAYHPPRMSLFSQPQKWRRTCRRRLLDGSGCCVAVLVRICARIVFQQNVIDFERATEWTRYGSLPSCTNKRDSNICIWMNNALFLFWWFRCNTKLSAPIMPIRT